MCLATLFCCGIFSYYKVLDDAINLAYFQKRIINIFSQVLDNMQQTFSSKVRFMRLATPFYCWFFFYYKVLDDAINLAYFHKRIIDILYAIVCSKSLDFSTSLILNHRLTT